jgi:hypothetical protein
MSADIFETELVFLRQVKLLKVDLHLITIVQLFPNLSHFKDKTSIIRQAKPSCWNHIDHAIHIERVNMHWEGIVCTISFDMGLISTEGQKIKQGA